MAQLLAAKTGASTSSTENEHENGNGTTVEEAACASLDAAEKVEETQSQNDPTPALPANDDAANGNGINNFVPRRSNSLDTCPVPPWASMLFNRQPVPPPFPHSFNGKPLSNSPLIS